MNKNFIPLTEILSVGPEQIIIYVGIIRVTCPWVPMKPIFILVSGSVFI